MGRMTRVAPGQLVEVLLGTVDDQLRVAADLDEATGVIGVDDEEADPRVREKIATLAPFERGVHAGTDAVVVVPDEAGLGLAIGQHRCQHGDDRPGQQVQVGFRDGDVDGHRESRGGHAPSPGDACTSRATTWVGRMRQSTGTSVSARTAGTHSPK